MSELTVTLPQYPPGADWQVNVTSLSQQVEVLVNNHRVTVGATALGYLDTLDDAAVWKARHMATYRYMAHDDPAPPVARSVSDRLADNGYPSSLQGWGENIAYGYPDADAVVAAWLASAGHRANLESTVWTTTGLGAAAASDGTLYWVQDFGTGAADNPDPVPVPLPPVDTRLADWLRDDFPLLDGWGSYTTWQRNHPDDAGSIAALVADPTSAVKPHTLFGRFLAGTIRALGS